MQVVQHVPPKQQCGSRFGLLRVHAQADFFGKFEIARIACRPGLRDEQPAHSLERRDGMSTLASFRLGLPDAGVNRRRSLVRGQRDRAWVKAFQESVRRGLAFGASGDCQGRQCQRDHNGSIPSAGLFRFRHHFSSPRGCLLDPFVHSYEESAESDCGGGQFLLVKFPWTRRSRRVKARDKQAHRPLSPTPAYTGSIAG